MKDHKLKLEVISFDDLVKEVERRYGKRWRIIKLQRCSGCDKLFSARKLRSHECSVGWKKRMIPVVVDRRLRDLRCRGKKWKICSVCGGRVHKPGCAAIRDPEIDCCEARHAAIGVSA
jgi:hypothetical protein